MTTQQTESLQIVLDFVERWNKFDKDTETAEAAAILTYLNDSTRINHCL